MLPIRDNIPSRGFPIINLLIIVANIVAFAHELTLGSQLQGWLFEMGLVPQRFLEEMSGAMPLSLTTLFSPFTYMFLHGGWLHIIGNLWILWIFGDNIEDRLGHFRYLIFYLLAGLVSGGLHLITNPTSAVPTVGASGAIAGIMGGYFLLFPGARILTLVPIFVFLQFIELPAFIFLGFWFLMQFLMGAGSLMSGGMQGGGIAWWAHIGGFIFGLLTVKLFSRR